jgi:hypothetical protein
MSPNLPRELQLVVDVAREAVHLDRYRLRPRQRPLRVVTRLPQPPERPPVLLLVQRHLVPPLQIGQAVLQQLVREVFPWITSLIRGSIAWLGYR